MRSFLVTDAWAAESSAPLADSQAMIAADPSLDVSPQKMLMDNLMLLGLLFFIFYFMLIRPQQRRLKAHQSMVKALAKGSKVITGGGIIGTIVKFEGDDVVVVEIAPEVKVRVARSSISDVVESEANKTANDN